MALNEFLNDIPSYIGIIALMFGAFLIGYFSAYFQYKKIHAEQLRKLKRTNEHPKVNPKIADIETIFTEIKPKIIEVVKETQRVEPEPPAPKTSNAVRSGQEIAQSARSSYLDYTKNKPALNFDNFGLALPEEKQDLTKINGIGPYIEQRLNEIGIYNYDQISKFKDEDIQVLTELIDFFPGRIERDNWIGQANSLKK